MSHDNELEDDTIEIELRPQEEVAARLVILAAVIRRSALELPLDDEDDDEYDDQADSPEGEQFDILAALTSEPLSRYVTRSELQLVKSPIGSRGEGTALETFWQIEALAALTAVVAAGYTLLDPWTQVETGPLLSSIPEPWDEFGSFARSVELINEESIALERERAELWLWRCAIDDELREATGREKQELLEIVRETVKEAVEAEILVAGRDDFQVSGRDFAKADVETKAVLTEISTQRLKALNWVCGFGDSWDSVPLDI